MARTWRTAALATAGAALMVTSGCWPTRGQGPDRTGHNPFETAFSAATVDDIALRWTFDADPAWWASQPTGAVVSGGRVYVASPTEDGYRAFALDPATGTPTWTSIVDGEPGDDRTPPAVAGGQVLVSTVRDTTTAPDTDHGTTRAFDAATGADLGVVGDGGELQPLRGDYGALAVPDADMWPTGTSWTIWHGDLTAPASPGRRTVVSAGEGSARQGFGGVTVGEDHVFHAGIGVSSTRPGAGQAADGVRAYARRSAGPTTCGPLGDPQAPVRVECPTWVAAPLDVHEDSAPVLGDGGDTLYVTANFDGLVALDAATGTEEWRGTTTIAPPVTTPALAHGRLYAGTDFGIAVYDADGCGSPTCAPLWESGPTPSGEPNHGQAVEQAVVAGDLVIVPVLGEGGRPGLRAYDADGCGTTRCDPVWSRDLPSDVVGELAVSGGQLYVPTLDGLLAFGPS